MALFEQGGGGGRVGEPTVEDFSIAPIDLTWPPTPEQWAALQEFLQLLSKNTVQNIASPRLLGRYSSGVGPQQPIQVGDRLTLGSDGVLSADEQSSGVAGPVTSVVGNLASWADVTGDTLADSGVAASQLITASTLGYINTLTVIVTAAQIRTLNSFPLTLIAAPGATQTIVPIAWALHKASAAGGYSSNPDFSIRYSGVATVLLTSITPGLAATAANWEHRIGTGAGLSTTDPSNKAVVLFSTADVTGGSALVTINLWYAVMTAI